MFEGTNFLNKPNIDGLVFGTLVLTGFLINYNRLPRSRSLVSSSGKMPAIYRNIV